MELTMLVARFCVVYLGVVGPLKFASARLDVDQTRQYTARGGRGDGTPIQTSPNSRVAGNGRSVRVPVRLR